MADEQVDDAVAYISGDNPTAALQWLERVEIAAVRHEAREFDEKEYAP